jgi:hypothetical protein
MQCLYRAEHVIETTTQSTQHRHTVYLYTPSSHDADRAQCTSGSAAPGRPIDSE